MISSAMTSTESCASPNVFAEPSTVTSADRSASVISPHASNISTMTLRTPSSLHFAFNTLSNESYESCFSVVV